MGSDGARANGRLAAAYFPLVDVDPQLADLLLEALQARAIAAYAVPTTGQRGALTSPPVRRPLDRVYVDAAQLPSARALVDEQLPLLRREREGASAVDEDAAWAQIVAEYDLPAVDPPRPRQPPGPLRPPGPLGPPGPPGEHSSSPGTPSSSPATDPGEHFVPPPPPPLPRADPLTRLGWAGLLGGPVLLTLAAFLHLPVDGWLGLALVAAFVGGFVLLVARMHGDNDDDTAGDDGAVV